MRKKLSIVFITLFLGFSATAFAVDEATGVLPATMEKYKIVKEKVEALSGTVAAKRAPEVVEDAVKSIAAAQEGLKSGNDRVTRESLEKALLQINLANALTAERSSEDITVAAKAELEKQEQRLVSILAGKGGN